MSVTSVFNSGKALKPKCSNQLTNYLKIYHDFAYFLCLAPFRLRLDNNPDSGENTPVKYKVKRWWPQVLVSGLLTLLGLTWHIRDIRISLPGSTNSVVGPYVNMKNPSLYFGVVGAVMGCLVRSAVIRVFWLKSGAICDICNFLLQEGDMLGGWERKPKWSIFLICFAYTGISVINWVLGRGLSAQCYEGPSVSSWSVDWWRNSVVEAARYNLFLGEGGGKVNTFLGIFGALGFYYRRVLGSHVNCFLLMAILTLRSCAKSFSDRLSLSGYDKWATVYYHYMALKQLTKLINRLYGLNVVLFLVEAVLYYAVSFDDIFIEHQEENDWTKVIRLGFYFVSTCAVLFGAADVSRKMNRFREWLSVGENRKGIGIDSLYVIFNELDNHSVAIRGYEAFPVNYGLAAKLLGATVTYFIICVQI